MTKNMRRGIGVAGLAGLMGLAGFFAGKTVNATPEAIEASEVVQGQSYIVPETCNELVDVNALHPEAILSPNGYRQFVEVKCKQSPGEIEVYTLTCADADWRGWCRDYKWSSNRFRKLQ